MNPWRQRQDRGQKKRKRPPLPLPPNSAEQAAAWMGGRKPDAVVQGVSIWRAVKVQPGPRHVPPPESSRPAPRPPAAAGTSDPTELAQRMANGRPWVVDADGVMWLNCNPAGAALKTRPRAPGRPTGARVGAHGPQPSARAANAQQARGQFVGQAGDGTLAREAVELDRAYKEAMSDDVPQRGKRP